MSQKENNNMDKYFYRASATDFNRMPGGPIAYWVNQNIFPAFDDHPKLSDIAAIKQGLATADNDRFLRLWFEVSKEKTSFSCKSRTEAAKSGSKWFPHSKGGEFRKWYGNREWMVNWENDGRELLDFRPRSVIRSPNLYFEECLSWTLISSSSTAFRYEPQGNIIGHKGPGVFRKENVIELMPFLNSKVANYILSILAPTIGFEVGQVSLLPIIHVNSDGISMLIEISKKDWDAYEISWDFSTLPLISASYRQPKLSETYLQLSFHWSQTIQKMERLEEGNNRLFINAYGLQDELTPEVPLKEITLTCNPHYRYGINKTDEELKAIQQSHTLAELISYIIGCMMGRYSLDHEGLVYAHAGNEGFIKLVEGGVYASFPADSDGILPLTSEAWFKDDIAARVEEFVRTVWGNKHLEENLKFIADSLCLAAIQPVKKGGETSRETIRRYLSTQFFKDHLKTYKKRPIYWLFSSGKEKAFECLVYLHRYNETTLPRMRTEYVTPLLGQMDSRIERLRLQQNEAETAEAKRIGKEIDSLTKQLTELRSFDDQLKHYADMKIQLDLDDGVKVNYGKFGTLLAEVKAITGDKAE